MKAAVKRKFTPATAPVVKIVGETEETIGLVVAGIWIEMPKAIVRMYLPMLADIIAMSEP